MPILARPKVLRKPVPQKVKPVPPKKVKEEVVRVRKVYRKAEERAAAKIPTLARVTKAGKKFKKAHPETASKIYTGFKKAHEQTARVGTLEQRQALAGYTYGSYQALQTKPIKTSAMFGAGMVGGRAISAVGKVGKAFGAGPKAARMAKAAELGIVGVYGVQTTKHIMEAPTPYRAGQRAAEAMYTEVLPMVAGVRIAPKKIVAVKPAKPKPPIVKKVKAKIKPKAPIRYKVAKVARPVVRPVKVKKVAVKRTIAEKKRIAKVQKLKSKSVARKQIKTVEKKIGKFSKQLKKLKENEKAEVEILRTKEKEVEKIKSPAEIQKEIIKVKAKIRGMEKTFERTRDLAIKGRIKIAQRQLKTLEREKVKREMVFEDIKKLKQKVRNARQKTKVKEREVEVEKEILKATKERLKVLVVAVERIQPEKVKEKEIEKEMEKELEKVREVERLIVRVSVREREIEKEREKEREKEKERIRERVKVKEKVILPMPVIPKLRPVKKKKPVKVVRKVAKEYSYFQIVNQIGGIQQIFG